MRFRIPANSSRHPEASNKKNNIAIELFCGVGGLSLGAARAGLKIVAGVDNDQRAILAHKKNFPSTIHLKHDIAQLDAETISKMAGFKRGQIESVFGGPPCQGFSRIGKRNPKDSRNSLLYHFFRIISELRPNFFLFENVPGILDDCFRIIRRHAFAQIVGYKTVGPMVLKASDFGAATSRERVFFIGYLPKFYFDFSPSDFMPDEDIAQIDVEFALKGLKKAINPSWQDEEQGWRSLTSKPKGPFWKKMFGDFPAGVGDRYALRALKEKKLVSGCLGTAHSSGVLGRFRTLPEGAVDKKSRAIRLKRRGHCPTLRAGTGPDHGSFQALRPIHPTVDRVITPREAARLQGFPDWFQFDSTKWHSFRQIGNSVSPILSEFIFRKILLKRKP